MSRFAPLFERLRAEKRTGLITFITCGYPSKEETVPLVRAMIEGGADAVELGVPFSDPFGEGPTIQRSSGVAVANGTTTRDVLAMARELRDGGIDAPLLTMGYVNSIEAYGVEQYAADAAAAGLDGLIVVDLPPEEAGPLHDACRRNGLDLVFLVAPTSTDERLAQVAKLASGFIYCVSVTGTTGSRQEVAVDLPVFIARVKQHTDLPLAVGFGVSRPEHVARIGQLCEAAVIGSAIIDTIERAPTDERAAHVRAYVEVVTGRRRV